MEPVGETKIASNGCPEPTDKDFRGSVFGGETWSNSYFMDCITDSIFEANLREGTLMADHFHSLPPLSGLPTEAE
jgi:hypothetical protein